MYIVRGQYSGSGHGTVKGIGVVNAFWQISKDDYTPIDYRIWNPPDDGKTKNYHFREMLSSAKCRGLEPEMVVAGSWYSSLGNLKSIRSHGWDWAMGLKSNCLVNKPHIQFSKIDILDEGLKVHLKGYGNVLSRSRCKPAALSLPFKQCRLLSVQFFERFRNTSNLLCN